MVSVCFICNHEKLIFEKYCEGGMVKHITSDHNLWEYVFYMVHLNTKPISDHTGIESYVLQKFKEKETSWLPRSKALCLTDMPLDGDEDEDTEAKQE